MPKRSGVRLNGQSPSATGLQATFKRGLALHQQGKLAEAERIYCDVLQKRPNHFDALHLLGVIAYQTRRTERAVDLIRRAIGLNAEVAAAHNNCGLALQDLKHPADAIESYDRAIALKPDYAEAHNNRGNALQDLRRIPGALASYDKAIALKPDYAEAYSNRAAALLLLDRHVDAEANFDRAIELKPDHAAAYSNRGNLLRDLKRTEEALVSYDRAIAIKPDYAEAHFNRGLTSLLVGDLLSGWYGYEQRWRWPGAPKKKLIAPWPEWKGEELQNKSIVVFEEQGLGDTIQFSRYLTRLSSSGAQVTFLVRASMHRIFKTFAPAIRLVDAAPTNERFDFQVALTSLPGVYRTTIETIPAECPYLLPEQPLVESWRARIGNRGFRIGVCWQGNPDINIDIGRSIPLRSFCPVACLPGVRLISLQKNYGLDQLLDLPAGMTVESLGEDFDSGSDAFVDTAAVVFNLDLVMTSDTSIAHLAGALGRPVWLILKSVPDWRWMLGRDDTPWYPSMRLFRQSSRNNWSEVFERVAIGIKGLPVRRRHHS